MKIQTCVMNTSCKNPTCVLSVCWECAVHLWVSYLCPVSVLPSCAFCKTPWRSPTVASMVDRSWLLVSHERAYSSPRRNDFSFSSSHGLLTPSGRNTNMNNLFNTLYGFWRTMNESLKVLLYWKYSATHKLLHTNIFIDTMLIRSQSKFDMLGMMRRTVWKVVINEIGVL